VALYGKDVFEAFHKKDLATHSCILDL